MRGRAAPRAAFDRAKCGARTAATPTLRLETASLHVNVDYESLGLRVSGEVGAADVVALRVTLLDEAGEPIAITDDEDGAFRLPFDRLTQRNGRFSGRAGIQAFGVEVVAGARVRVVDAEQQESETVDAVAEPPGTPPEGDCDPIRAADACIEGQLCTRRGCEPAVAECPDEWAPRVVAAGDEGVRDDTSGAPPLSSGSCGGGFSDGRGDWRAADHHSMRLQTG